jgi:hypothetical protein
MENGNGNFLVCRDRREAVVFDFGVQSVTNFGTRRASHQALVNLSGGGFPRVFFTAETRTPRNSVLFLVQDRSRRIFCVGVVFVFCDYFCLLSSR